MRRLIIEIVLGVLAAAGLGLGYWQWQSGGAARDQVAALTKQIDTLKLQHATQSAERANAAAKQIESLTAQVTALTAERNSLNEKLAPISQKAADYDAARAALSSGVALQDLEAAARTANPPSADRMLAIGAMRMMMRGKDDPEARNAFQKALELADWSSRLRAVCAAQAGLRAIGQNITPLKDCDNLPAQAPANGVALPPGSTAQPAAAAAGAAQPGRPGAAPAGGAGQRPPGR